MHEYAFVGVHARGRAISRVEWIPSSPASQIDEDLMRW